MSSTLTTPVASKSRPGECEDLFARVVELGSEASPATQARLIDRAQGERKGVQNCVASIPYLAPNVSVTVTFVLPYWVYNQPVHLEVTADYLNNVAECVETNNSAVFADQG